MKPIIGMAALAAMLAQQPAYAERAPAATASATPAIPGYRLGDPALPRSPVPLRDLDPLRAALLFGPDDLRYLRMAGEILVPQTERILDVWYGFVAATPALATYFTNPADGRLNTDYLARVRPRFGRWIRDTTAANYDQAWLDWQHEIGVRHTLAGKNRTDGVASAPQVNFRYLVALIVPISATVEPFLAAGDRSPEEVRRMMAAWNKAVTLQVILWSYPYVREGQF